MKTTATTANLAFDSVHVGEVAVDTLHEPVRCTAKVAYVDSKGGGAYGYQTRSAWSQDTLTKLRDLLDSMESDVLRDTFRETTSGSGSVVVEAPGDGVPGL